MKRIQLFAHARSAALCTLAAFTLGAPGVKAADHRDAPLNAQDPATDLADCYLFADPVTAGNVVLIATFHGFIVPGEAVNEAIFDPLANYRFEIYNDHVNVAPADLPAAEDKAGTRKYLNTIKPARVIEVSFSARTAADGPTGLTVLQVPQPQTATVKFTGFKNQPGFTGVTKKDTFAGLNVLNPTLSGTPPDPAAVAQAVGTGTGVQFFAGEVDDPFFFDIPAFGRFIGDIRGGQTAAAAAAAQFGRARDTFAGYNVLAIALSIPKAILLADPDKTKIGLNVVAQRHTVQIAGKGTIKGVGGLKSIDREGLPAINVALIPFRRKNEYNAATPKDDASGKFAGDIVATLQAINPGITTIGTLAGLAVSYGDLLGFDTAMPSGFPNGRKLTDDVIATILTVINNNNALDDGVTANDVPFTAVFPFLGKPQQPLANGATDNTQN